MGMSQPMPISKQSFVKVISGFGGCNAAVYCAPNAPSPSQQYTANTYSVEHHVRITPPSDLTEIYKQQRKGNLFEIGLFWYAH